MNTQLEIVAPAGTLESGLYALMGGADAVYFGLSSFSARKAAVNLSLQDVRRLKGYAVSHGKKIYAALNTIIAEGESAAVRRELAGLVLTGVDGVIVQDLGLAEIIRREYPSLSLHGSTQLAVHNADGLETARRLSFRRVVLSRELSLNEIDSLKTTAPEVEREVFVHGALCYGVSGLCLASSHLTGRSGNRGECAQICRTWFENGEAKGYFFSALDLEAGQWLDELGKSGVSALKIEGRMKSSAYAYHTAATYRALLDDDAEKAAFHRQRSALCFARPQTEGFLKSPKQTRLINAAYPSHMGIPGARVTSVTQGKLILRALTDLAAYDRLFRPPVSPPDEGDTIVLADFVQHAGRVRGIRAGETATIAVASRVRVGDTLMKTSAHDMRLKELSAGAYPEFVQPLTLRVRVAASALELTTEYRGRTVSSTYPVVMEKSRGERRFEDVLRALFSESKDNGFRFESLAADGEGGMSPADVFIPPKVLKRIRNDFYEKVAASIFATAEAGRPIDFWTSLHDPLPDRSRICYPDSFMFIVEGGKVGVPQAPVIDGVRYLSLSPVMFPQSKTVERIAREIEARPDERFMAGLNNLGHLAVAEAWHRFENVSFYIDYGLYAANTETVAFFVQTVRRLKGVYLWIEGNAEQRAALQAAIEQAAGCLPNGIRFIDEKERFALFISRICFKRSTEGACPKSCPKSFRYRLKQQKQHFDVRVVDCMTYTHLADS